MSLTDMVIMPGADYQAACDAIREKTEGVGYIRSGDMAERIRSIETGVQLPVLTNPASAADIASGKEAIDGEGNVLTGTGSLQETVTLTINNTDDSYPHSIGLRYVRAGDTNLRTTTVAAGATRELTLPNGSMIVVTFNVPYSENDIDWDVTSDGNFTEVMDSVTSSDYLRVAFFLFGNTTFTPLLA